MLAYFLLFISIFSLAAPIDELEKLVNLNSGTGNTKGVTEVTEYVADRLQKLGFTIETIKHPKDLYASLMIATRKGSDEKFITMLAHADTVFEPDSKFQKMTLSEDKKTAYGPGVVDDKGGIIVALTGLEEYFAKKDDKKHSFKFVLSPNEEVGSDGFTKEFKPIADKSWLVLSFEGSHETGSLVDSRKGNRWYLISVEGREAHAGRDHKYGINACNELAIKLAAISKLTNYSKEITVNVGAMKGGKDKFNIVCDHAEAKIDTRFFSTNARDKLHLEILNIINQVNIHAVTDKEPAETTYQIVDDSPPFARIPKADSYIKKYLAAIKQVEKKQFRSGPSSGVGDANFFAESGAIVLDGLGPTGGKMHTEGEFLKVDTLSSRASALSLFLQGL